MGGKILLYGATGYSGKLVADEAARRGMSTLGPDPFDVILAGRNGPKVSSLAAKHGMEFRVFGLEDREEVIKGLIGVDVVLNAAGPYAFTADTLAKAAIVAGVHYVDLNGELDVYQKLRDLGIKAGQRGVALVSSAGHTCAASNMLLSEALDAVAGREIGDIRIAVSQPGDFSHGSALTAARSLREQVMVMRTGLVADALGNPVPRMVAWHESVGRLERTFDFGPLPGAPPERRVRIATAANLVDTAAADLVLRSKNCSARSITSYVQMGASLRAAYVLGAAMSSLYAVPTVKAYVAAQLKALPDGAGPEQLQKDWHVVVLQIDDPFQSPIIEWRLQTPQFYAFTARVAVEVARRVVGGGLEGWTTPAEALGKRNFKSFKNDLVLNGCELDKRVG